MAFPDVLYKDIHDIPSVGQIVDENYNILKVKTGFKEINFAGDSIVIDAVEGRRIRILYICVHLSAAINYYFKGDAAKLCSTKSVSYVGEAPDGTFLFETPVGENFIINCDAATPVGIDYIYIEVPTD